MLRMGLMWGAARLPPAAHCLVALASFARRFGLWPWAVGHRRGTGCCSGVPLLGWSIPHSSLSAVEPRGTQIYAYRFMPAHGAGRDLTALCALSPCLQLGAEPNSVGVNKQACPVVRGGSSREKLLISD